MIRIPEQRDGDRVTVALDDKGRLTTLCACGVPGCTGTGQEA